MPFTSLHFLLFFLATVTAYFSLPARFRLPLLLVASFGFYMFRKPIMGVFLAAAILITYAAGRLIDKQAKNSSRRRMVLAVGILLNFSFLLWFKYYNFAAESLNSIFGLMGAGWTLSSFDILLPVGISFYTFQTTGYMVDVYRGQIAPEKNILKYALFASFFPQIMAGPIGRATKLLPQWQQPAKFDYTRIKHGLLLIGWGFFQKLVIADRLAQMAIPVLANYKNHSGAVLVLSLFFFAMYMYCDFASYSTMAVGAAQVFGIELAQNFALPYFSSSIPEFWRRWHITLGEWFKDYLFYPIMRSKLLRKLPKSKLAKRLPRYYAQNLPVVLGLLVVWFCTGLWHGANWTFVVWGLYHGALIILGVLFAPSIKKLSAKLKIPAESKGLKLFGIARTFVLVCIGYVFFQSATLADAMGYFRQIGMGWGGKALVDGTLFTLGLNEPNFIVACIALVLLLAINLLQTRIDILNWVQKQRLFIRWGIYLAGLLIVVVFGAYGMLYKESAFVYFEF